MRRLTPATLTLVMFGIVGLLVVGYVAKTMLAGQEKPPAPIATRDVPMAVTDVAAGTIITENHLGMGKYPRDKLTSDVLLANRVIIGRVTKGPLKAATPIKANQLYQPGELPPLEVAEGMRAVSVLVGDGVAMVDGMIKPGQFVDILFTASAGGPGVVDSSFQGGFTMRLFEGVKILAINRNFTQSRVDRGANHVTLELTQAQTNIVVLAQDRGKLTLTYNPSDAVGDGGLALSNEERVTLFEILGLKKQEPVNPKDPIQTEIYRGHSRITVQFDEKGKLLSGGSSGGGYGWNTGGYIGGVPNGGGNVGGGYGNGNYYLPPSDQSNSNGGPGVAPNNGRQNVPTPSINQPGQPMPRQNDNPPAARVPTASLPMTLPN